jgi:membrane-bound serine protease (ClpP class)
MRRVKMQHWDGTKKISAKPTLAPQTGWSLTDNFRVSDHPVRSIKGGFAPFSLCRVHPSSRGGDYARRRQQIVSCIFVLLLGAHLALAQSSSTPIVVQIDLNDIVHPVSATYVKDSIKHAKDIGAQAVILRLDTPGGLADSMREIVEAILSSPVPVITWVGPNGARAASAGFFILLAGDVAVMAPGTNAGAAHPVTATGQKIEDVMEKKIVSDASAYIRSYTAKRGRNAQFAESAVTESRSFTAEEAMKDNLIDAVISDVQGIIDRYDDKDIRRFDDRLVKLHLHGATIQASQMTSRQKILSRVLDPNLALILALAGLLGLYIEITHPGLIAPGIIGAISLILALFAFNMLPVNWAGAALILLAIVLFVLEATVTSHGLLAVGGIIAMIAGGLMLVEGPIPQLRVRLSTALGLAFPFAIITVVLVRLVYLSHRRKSIVGEEAMVGEVGIAKSDIHKEGKVMIRGEYWNAYSERPIPAGARVRVVKVDGLTIEVEQV